MRFLILSPVILFSAVYCMQAQITWQRIYPQDFGISTSWGRDVQPTADGGFIFTGEIDYPTGAIRHYVRLLKINASGDVEWDKIYKDNEITDEAGLSVRVTPDGEYVVAGRSNGDAYLLRISATGDTIYTKTFGTGGYDLCETVRIMPGGDYILGCGSGGFDSVDPFVVRTDTSGNILWQDNFGFAPIGGTGVEDMEIVSDEEIVALYNNGIVRLAGLDGDGGLLWNSSFQFTKYDAIPCFTVAGDDKYILGGLGTGFAGSSPILARVTQSGIQEWQVGPDPANHAISSVETLPGGDLITGMFDWVGFPPSGKVYISKFNASGNQLWSKSYPGDASPFKVYPLSDGGFIGCGTLNGQMMLIRTDANGDITPSGAENPVVSSATVFPNPANDKIMVTMPEDTEGFYDIRLFSADGVLLSALNNEKVDFEIDISEMPAGAYFISITTNDGTYAVPFIRTAGN